MSIITRSVRRRISIQAFSLLVACLAVLPDVNLADDEPASEPVNQRKGYLIQVPLPIVGSVNDQVRGMITRLLARLPKDGPRPVLVLEFDPKEGLAGESSEFGDCFELSDFLSGPELRRVRTVAYLPRSVKGHSVLPVLACEEIIMHRKDAQFGAAGISTKVIPETMRVGYQEIANRRGVIPAPFAVGLLDKELEVSKVTTLNGVRYVFPEELRRLEKAGQANVVKTVIHAGELPTFSGVEMREEFGFASHLVDGRKELASALQLPTDSLEGDPSLGETWRSVRLELHGRQKSLMNVLHRPVEIAVTSGPFHQY